MNGQNAPEASTKRLLLQGLIAGVVIGLCLGLGLGVAEYAGLYVTRFSVMIFAGLFWTCIAMLALCLLSLFVRRFRPATIRFLFGESVAIATLAVAVIPVVGFAHGAVLSKEMENARPVIEALKDFREENGRSAKVLGQLMPRYLDALPTPRLQVCKYGYEITAIGQTPRESRRDLWKVPDHERTWEFSIECPADWMFDVEILVYRPDGQYEVNQHAWKQRPLGDWMYYNFRD